MENEEARIVWKIIGAIAFLIAGLAFAIYREGIIWGWW